MDGGTPDTTPHITSDFEWICARFASASVIPSEVLAINGQNLSIGGNIMIKEPAPVRYALCQVAEGAGNLAVEIDRGPR
jgi:hypothetical protein